MGTETAGEVLLKTPLYDTHVTYKGKIVPFAGYLLPVQYETGVIEEHMAVRTKCGTGMQPQNVEWSRWGTFWGW